MSKIGFLFGAGAEASYIKTGDKFANAILNVRNNNYNVNNALKKHFTSGIAKLSKTKYWYPSCNEANYKIDTLAKNSLRKKWLSEGRDFNSIKNLNGALSEEMAKTYSDENSKIDLILKYPNFMGILDERFHTLISPRALGPNKFWSVLMTYSRAYVNICSEILGVSLEEEKNVIKLISNPQETYNNILMKIREFQDDDSVGYYKIIANSVHSERIFVATTNYTPICENFLNLNSDRISYLNGSIKWFESAYSKQVIDINKDSINDDDILFPFLFVQSGVKPLINEIQIEQFHKFTQWLKQIDTLIILGYRLNLDDSHINVFIKSFLNLKTKSILFFNFDSEDRNTIIGRLGLDSKTVERFRIIEIDKLNCFEIFKRELNSIK